MRKTIKSICSLFLSAIMLTSLFVMPVSAAEGDIEINLLPDVTGDATSYQMTNSTVKGTKPAKVITITADSGSFEPKDPNPPGVTFVSGLTDGNEYVDTFSAEKKYKYLLYQAQDTQPGTTAEELQTYIRNLTCYFDSDKNVQTISVGVDYTTPQATGPQGDLPLTYYNGSYYGYVSNIPDGETTPVAIDWKTSFNQAQEYSYKGNTGYLLTIESEEEHNLVFRLQNGKSGWAGGTRMVTAADADALKGIYDDPTNVVSDDSIFSTSYTDTTTYGAWYWICGPNAGTKFYEGASKSVGTTIPGIYTNWSSGQPDNASTSEGYLQYGFGASGAWNDLSVLNGNYATGYYIEFTPKSETQDSSASRTTHRYTVSYEWEGAVPKVNKVDITPPAISVLLEKTNVEVDTEYTSGTAIPGFKDGKPGTWIFRGWNTDADLTDGIISDVTYKGKWDFTADKYTVTYEWTTNAPSDKAVPVDKTQYEYNAPVIVDNTYVAGVTTSTAKKDGADGTWTFKGWTPSPSDPAEGIKANTTYTGDWTFVPSYTVTYDWGNDVPEGVTLPAISLVPENTMVEVDTEYTSSTSISVTSGGAIKGTWTFSGWTPSPSDPAEGIKANTTYTGEWTFVPSYTVTYDWGTDVPEGVTLPAISVVPENTMVEVDTEYTSSSAITGFKDGSAGTWKFSGWTTTSDLADGITSDVLFTGAWTFTKNASSGGGGNSGTTNNKLTVTYDPNGGTGTVTNATNSYNSGSTVTVLPNGDLSKENAEFAGWNTKPDGTGTSYNAGDTFKINSGVTLYAQWNEKKEEVDDDGLPFIKRPHYAYLVGYEDNTIRPNGEITRAEVVTVFFRLLKDDIRSENWSKLSSYNDVNTPDWFNNPVATMSKMNVLKGYEDGSFRPNGAITRAEAAAIISRFVTTEVSVGASKFTDVDDSWAKDDINRVAALGWIEGNGGLFRPQDNITRAEFVTMVNRALERQPENNYDLLPSMKTWSDNGVSNWYYLAIQEATNDHDFDYKTTVVPGKSFFFEHWTNFVNSRNWLALHSPDATPDSINS